MSSLAFSALTLMVEEHLACRKLSDEVLELVWSKIQIQGAWKKRPLKTYGPADAIATLSSLASLKSKLVYPFFCQLTQVVLEKRLLTGCQSI